MNENMEKQIADIKSQLTQLERGNQNKIAMIVFDGSLDKMLAAFNIATGAAASGMDVVMFFTFWGIAAFRDPNKRVKNKNFISKMFGFMLPKGRSKIRLSQMNMLGLGTAMIKSLMKKKNVASLDQLIDIAGQLGVRIYICEMSMNLMGFQREEMIDFPGLKFCGVATFLSEAQESKIQLFI